MAVLRNQRNYPLVLKADALNTGIVAAFDWAAEDGSTDASNGKDHSGNARHYTAPATTPPIVQTVDGKGRDTSVGQTLAANTYQAASVSVIGLNVGTGDFTIFKRMRMPTYVPATIDTREVGRLTDGAGEKMSIRVYERNDLPGWRWSVTFGTIVLAWNSAGNPTLASGEISTLHIKRASGTVKCFVNGVLVTTVTGNVIDLLSTTAGSSKTIVGNYSTGDTMVDAVFIDDIYWNRALSDGEVAAHAANPYSYYNATVAPNTIDIDAPLASSTVGTSFTISGNYSGADIPSAIEASFNGGAWTTIDSTLSAGEYSGTLSGQAAGTGTLSARWVNFPAVIATAANVTVAAASIAFTAPSPQQSVRAFRTFQRDALNRSIVRVSGTYIGTPTALEYRWNAGAWTTLDAAPAAGVFDKTITLQGPGQGTFEVRFANSTGVVASLASVGVGDVYVVAGRSNHVGMSAQYVSPVAPAGFPLWKSTLCGKDGVWRAHLETSASLFDDRTGALYAVEVNATAPLGSYFGALATKIMAAGVPVAFVPCALGSSSLADWAVSESTATLYGAALARAALVGDYKAVLWWQGEQETGGSATQAALVTSYNALVNGWFTRTGKKWFVWAIDGDEAGINFQNVHDALIEVGQTNANCAGYADLLGSFESGIHYSTGLEIGEIANRTFSALNKAYGYVPNLTSPTATPTSATTATCTVTTDQASGTLYYLVSTNATESAATIKASGSTQAITSVGTKTMLLTSLTPTGTYYLHMLHRNNSGYDSAVARTPAFVQPAQGATGSFTTESLVSSGTLRANQAVVYSWFSGGVVGSTVGIVSHGSGTLSAQAKLTVSNLPLGAGFILIKTEDGGIYYQEGTVA